MKSRSFLQIFVVYLTLLIGSLSCFAQTQCTSVRVAGLTSATFPNSGGTGTFFLSTLPGDCSVSFSTVFAPFVFILDYNQFSGAVTYEVASNPGNARSGTIEITAGTTSAQFAVLQQAAPPPPEPAPPVVDMFRYFNAGFNHHFYTTNFAEEGYGGSGGWSYEGIPFHVLGSQQAGSVPLYRYFASSTKDHFYTTDFSELGNGAQGYVLEETQCYVYPTQQSGTIPLYRYRNVNTGEHFYTTNINEVGGNPAYILEKIQAYVLP